MAYCFTFWFRGSCSITSKTKKYVFPNSLVDKGPKYLKCKVLRVSMLGIAIMVSGRYLIVGYLDP